MNIVDKVTLIECNHAVVCPIAKRNSNNPAHLPFEFRHTLVEEVANMRCVVYRTVTNPNIYSQGRFRR